MWYYFSVASIDNEGNMDIHTDPNVEQLPPFGYLINPASGVYPATITRILNTATLNEIRKLSDDLYDLPGPSNNLWSGYVQADTELLACKKVTQEY